MKTFRVGDLVEFSEFWGGYNVILVGQVTEVTSYRLSVQSIRGTSMGYTFQMVSPNRARPFTRS